MRGAPLIALACSATKVNTGGLVPAINRYDGPMWRTLRVALGETPRRFAVWVLSAQFGFLPAETPIPHYDRELSPSRAAELLRLPSSDHAAFAEAVRQAGPVLFAGGQLYRDTMRRACPFTIAELAETTGGGIGVHRAELRAWIAAL